jgi:hypothetical protein
MRTIELNEQEREYLLEVLEAATKEKLHELHHADSSDYKRLLRHRLELLESLTAKLLPVPVAR